MFPRLAFVFLLLGIFHNVAAQRNPSNPVNFQTSCNDSVKVDFNYAVSILHSFFYAEARKEFSDILVRDPMCGMAYWGIAMTIWHPLWKIPTVAEMERGRELMNSARTVQTLTPRELDYVNALDLIFQPTPSHREKVIIYKDVMKKLSEKYGKEDMEDIESTIFYCLSLITLADFSSNGKPHLLLAGRTLDLLVLENPIHPGILHYIIHAYDTADLAPFGLEAARKFQVLTAKAPHQLHMPSHIYQFLGLWQESINTNVESVRSTEDIDQILHSIKYVIYALIQSGQVSVAKKMIEDYVWKFDSRMLRTDSNFTMAGELVGSTLPFFADTLSHEEMLTFTYLPNEFHWAEEEWTWILLYSQQMIAASKLKRLPVLDELHFRLLAANKSVFENPKYANYQVAKLHYWKSQAFSAIAWMKWARGETDFAIQMLEKHTVEYDHSLYPTYEMLGEMEFLSGKYTDAKKSLEKASTSIPNRFNTLYLAAATAEKLQESFDRDRFLLQLVALCPDGNKICPNCTETYKCERYEWIEAKRKLERYDWTIFLFGAIISSFSLIACGVGFLVFGMLMYSIYSSRKMGFKRLNEEEVI